MLMPISGTRLGRISTKMMRQLGSPTMRAATMNSRLRSASVCARVMRAPHGHEVSAMIVMMASGPTVPAKEASRINSGMLGMTSTALVRRSSVPSMRPPK